MKILITYYSYSGITERVVNIWKEILEKKAELKIQRLKPKEEITSFFLQCMSARFKKRCDIEDAIYEVSGYDIVIIGLPVWAFAPVPAINTFLDNVKGIENKKVIVLLTSGSGAGVGMCFKYIDSLLRNKGVSDIAEISIPNARMNDKDFVISALKI